MHRRCTTNSCQLAGLVWTGAVGPRARDRLPDCNRRRNDVVFRRNRNILIHPQAFRSGKRHQQMRCSVRCARRPTSLWLDSYAAPWIGRDRRPVSET